MSDDENRVDPELPDDAHFSDEELQSALAEFEREFQDGDLNGRGMNGEAGGGDASNDASKGVGGGVVGDASANGAQGCADNSDVAGKSTNDGDTVAKGAERALNFDDELEGLIGNRAKAAILSTGLASADLLAAFCQMADISADCLYDDRGAVAILRNLNGDSPESAARDLTRMITGMPVVLCVNRAAKLTATLYVAGEPGRQFAPPFVLSSTPPAIEDLMLGVSSVDDLKRQGEHLVNTADFDHNRSMQVIAEHMKFGRGGPSIE